MDQVIKNDKFRYLSDVSISYNYRAFSLRHICIQAPTSYITYILIQSNTSQPDTMAVGPESRYESDNVSPAHLGKPLEFPFSGKTAPNRLYAPIPLHLQQALAN